MSNSNVTPRCRKSGGSLTRTRTRTCGPNSQDGYYMPRQGLFDRDHAFTLLDDLDSEDQDHNETSEYDTSEPPRLSAEEMEVFSFYGGGDQSRRPYTQPSSPNARSQVQSPCTPYTLPLTPNTSSRTSHQSRPCQGDNDLVALLQNQQGMLKQLIEEQKSMKALQDTMKLKQDELETKLEGLVDSVTSSGSDCRSQQKAKVTRQLSNLVAEAYDSLENTFKPEESSLSEHNQRIKSLLQKCVVSEKFSKEQVKLRTD